MCIRDSVVSGLMGGLGGLASAMACMSALGPASSEESAGHSAMRGLIPVSRTAQVVGRYLFLLVVGLLWALDVVICGGVFIVFGDIADMGWIGTLAAGAFIFALAIILGSGLLACAYRFTFRKMMVASVAVRVGLYAVIALLARLPVDWQWLLLNKMCIRDRRVRHRPRRGFGAGRAGCLAGGCGRRRRRFGRGTHQSCGDLVARDSRRRHVRRAGRSA